VKHAIQFTRLLINKAVLGGVLIMLTNRISEKINLIQKIPGNTKAIRTIETGTSTNCNGLAQETTLLVVSSDIESIKSLNGTMSNQLSTNVAQETTLQTISTKLSTDVAQETTLQTVSTKLSDVAQETTLQTVSTKLSTDVAQETSLQTISTKLSTDVAQQETLQIISNNLNPGQTYSASCIPVVLPFDYNQSLYGEFTVVERTPIINLQSVYGLSGLRDRIRVSGDASVQDTFTTGTGEYMLLTTTNGADQAQLFSAQRGLYQSGYSANAGIGVRIPINASANQEFFWGLGEDPGLANSNGLYFGQDSNGLFIAIRRNGSTSKTYQVDWNEDPANGQGTSGYTLDISHGNIYQIELSWYGYGLIQFYIVRPLTIGSTRLLVHQSQIQGSTSITSPNLPLMASISNNGSSVSGQLFLAGRQYSVRGRVNPQRRITSERRFAVTVGTSTLIPLISFQRKSTYSSVSLKLAKYDIITNNNLIIEVRFNASLTGASWTTPTNTSANETGVNSDISATAVSGGILVWTSLISGGSTKNSELLNSVEMTDVDLPQRSDADFGTISFCAQSISSSSNVDIVFLIREEW